MSQSLKILVCGDVEGRFSQIFTRVANVEKKAGPFDSLLCVGDFFGADNSEWADYVSGDKKVPINTFVIGPLKSDHSAYFTDINGCELCDNVTYVGRKGVYTANSGLTIAYLSGLEGPSSDGVHFSCREQDALKYTFTSDSSFKGVDIFLTSQWPQGVERYAATVDGVDSKAVGSPIISQIALMLRPRYHFCAKEGAFLERPPYRNHKVLQERDKHVTRFVALAKVGNAEKKKFLYAFNITPMKYLDTTELQTQPPDVTECPYKADPSVGRPVASQENVQQFFYDQNALQRGKRKSMSEHGGTPRKQAQPTGPCWFCLGSPEVEKHLVVSVGTEAYLALAKGGLTPEHVLISPITHHQSLVSAPSEVVEEIEKYKDALKSCFRQQGKAVVFFERNYKTAHLQVQAVPIPAKLAATVKETFQELALSQDMELAEIPTLSDLKQIVGDRVPYFYVETPLGDKLLRQIGKGGFSLQFGREALADSSLLNMPEKADWRACKVDRTEEVAMATQFSEMFREFDFNQ